MRIVLGVTGASGSPYALRLMDVLLAEGAEVIFIASAAGERVFEFETGRSLAGIVEARCSAYPGSLRRYDADDLFAPVASGSYPVDGMAVIPCSMSTAAAIASGAGGNLLRRAADVQLKERRPLVVVPRECPLSSIHLRNLLGLSEAGAVVLPAAPGFYGRPQSVDELIDFVVGRVLSALGIATSLGPRWEGASTP